METSAAISHGEEEMQRKPSRMAACLLPLCGVVLMLLVVVWDMNKVHQLSTVIHNDHSSLWTEMNESTVHKIYSPMSLCILDAPPTALTSFEIKNVCAERNRKERFAFCTVGFSFNKECLGSLLSQDSYYFKILRDPRYHSAHEEVHAAMGKLARAGWSVVFVGDKVSLQSMNAMLCALESHRDVELTQHSSTNFTVSWRDSTSIYSLEIIFQSLRAIKYSSEDDKHISGEAMNNFNRMNGTSTTLEIAQRRVAMQLQRFNGVLVIANVGSYYNNRISFREDVPLLMKWLNELGRHNIAVFRESASQHWNLTRSGYYSVQKKHEAEAVSCVPNIDSSPNLDWRNRDAASCLITYDFKNIHWLYFHDITAPLYSMHPLGLNSSSFEDVDCTQYCYFPQMWQPIWVQLYELIIDNPKLLHELPHGHSRRHFFLRAER